MPESIGLEGALDGRSGVKGFKWCRFKGSPYKSMADRVAYKDRFIIKIEKSKQAYYDGPSLMVLS